MGTFAEDCAEAYQFTRAEQDAYALSLAGARQIARSRTALRRRDRAGQRARRARPRRRSSSDEQPPKARPDKIPTLKARLREGRHGDGRQFQLDLRWRRGAGADAARARPRSAASTPLAPIVAPRHPRRARPSEFPTAPIGAMREAVREDRLGRDVGRPVRDQRGLRRRRDGGDARPRAAARQGQRERRRLRARPPDRRFRRAHPGHADRRWRARGLKRGVASLCIGGGEATAMAIEAA